MNEFNIIKSEIKNIIIYVQENFDKYIDLFKSYMKINFNLNTNETYIYIKILLNKFITFCIKLDTHIFTKLNFKLIKQESLYFLGMFSLLKKHNMIDKLNIFLNNIINICNTKINLCNDISRELFDKYHINNYNTTINFNIINQKYIDIEKKMEVLNIVNNNIIIDNKKKIINKITIIIRAHNYIKNIIKLLINKLLIYLNILIDKKITILDIDFINKYVVLLFHNITITSNIINNCSKKYDTIKKKFTFIINGNSFTINQKIIIFNENNDLNELIKNLNVIKKECKKNINSLQNIIKHYN